MMAKLARSIAPLAAGRPGRPKRAARRAASGEKQALTRHCLKCRRRFASEGLHHRICRTCKRVRSPDEADAETLLDSEASRARRERGLRLLMGLSPVRSGVNDAVLDLPFCSCQWIAGEPSADEACKCGAAVVRDAPYCARHLAESRLERPQQTSEAPQQQAA